MGKLLFAKNDLIKSLEKAKKDSSVWLVGDQGVYLMFDKEVVYAKGCNPETDEDWWEKKGKEFGGDDGGDEIGNVGQLLIATKKAKNNIIINLTKTQIKVSLDI